MILTLELATKSWGFFLRCLNTKVIIRRDLWREARWWDWMWMMRNGEKEQRRWGKEKRDEWLCGWPAGWHGVARLGRLGGEAGMLSDICLRSAAADAIGKGGGCRSHDQRERGTPIMPSCKPMLLWCQCASLSSVPYVGTAPQSKARSKRLGEEFKASHRAPF